MEKGEEHVTSTVSPTWLDGVPRASLSRSHELAAREQQRQRRIARDAILAYLEDQSQRGADRASGFTEGIAGDTGLSLTFVIETLFALDSAGIVHVTAEGTTLGNVRSD